MSICECMAESQVVSPVALWPIVAVKLDGVPTSFKFKCWRHSSTFIQWGMLAMMKPLYPAVNTHTSTFRVEKHMSSTCLPWLARLQKEGQPRLLTYFPSIRSGLDTTGLPPNSVHERAALSTYGLLSLSCWVASMRSKPCDRVPGVETLKGFLYKFLPTLREPDINVASITSAHKGKCTAAPVDARGRCHHLQALHARWHDTDSDMDNIVGLLGQASSLEYACVACQHVYCSILKRLEELVYKHFPSDKDIGRENQG